MEFKVGDKVVAIEDEYAAYEDWVEMAAGDTGTVISVDGEYFVSIALDEQDVPEEDRTWCSVAKSKLGFTGSLEASKRLTEYYQRGLVQQDKEVEKALAAKRYYVEKLQELGGGGMVVIGSPLPLYRNTWDAYND